MQELIAYIISYLARQEYTLESLICYSADPVVWREHRIAIVPSGFFTSPLYLHPKSLPTPPYYTINDTPLLFGDDRVEQVGDTLVIYADIIASSFFFLSRYEEVVSARRDEHGRFLAEYSLQKRLDILHRPIVDEYGELLRTWMAEAGLKINNLDGAYNSINLTFDVDLPLRYHRPIHARTPAAFKGYLTSIKDDPYFTYPMLTDAYQRFNDRYPGRARLIGFWLMSKETHYSLASWRIRELFEYLIETSGLEIGLHCSYASGVDSAYIYKEYDELQSKLDSAVRTSRHHYLRQLSPADYHHITAAGIHEDYTMGYADCAGFRLGTSRAVRAINPISMQLESLILYPLTMMECTLDRPQYMGLTYDQAFDYVKQLCSQTRRHRGDLTLLWHNNSLADRIGSYQQRLMSALVDHIISN